MSIGDRLRELFSKSGDFSVSRPAAEKSPAPPPPAPGKDESELVKRSHGLSHFVNSIREESGLSILDLGEISQPNVNFVTNLGHRLYSVDFLRTLDAAAGPGSPAGGPAQRTLMDSFIEQSLGFGPEELDGALIWDSLQYLSRPLLIATVNRLHEILKPGACLLAFFHTTERAEWLPAYSYRIASTQTLNLTWKNYRRPVEVFNNRGIERLFEQFESVKFFLTRDKLREVIIRR